MYLGRFATSLSDSNQFSTYANYYDLAYGSKNYASEATWIASIPEVKMIFQGKKYPDLLDLGSGTGSYAIQFSKMGAAVTGLDLSPEMVEIARQRSIKDGLDIEFQVGNAQDFDLGKSFDIVTCMFHVMSYQTDDKQLVDTFRSVKKSLRPGAIFVFDYWNHSGVLNDPPGPRRLIQENSEIKLTRETTATFNKETRLTEVTFDVSIKSKLGEPMVRFSEQHLMKSYDFDELSKAARVAGFTSFKPIKWMGTDIPAVDDWYATLVCS